MVTPSPTPASDSVRATCSGPARGRVSRDSAVSVRSVRQSTKTAPGTRPAAQTWWPLPSGRQRTSRIRTSGRPSWSASQSVEASSSGRARPPGVRVRVRWRRRHRRYHRGVVAPFLPDAEKVAAIRGALPALGAGIYLNTGSVGPMPAETAAAMAELVDYELRIGRSHPDYWEGFLERMAEARASVAAVIGADVGEIALEHSTSGGMNAAIWSVDLEPGDRIVTTQAEHPGGLGPVHVASARSGAELVIADVGLGGDGEATLAAFDAAITERTRIVAL